MKKKQVILSKRLHMLAKMVTPGNRVLDVGCDHGFLSIYLIQNGISPRVLATDVRNGPLACASEHVREYGLGTYIETRLSDGLKACDAEEADTVICAGMGGRLMERILTDSLEKVRQMKELILQPQSELREFRQFLRHSGFLIEEESAVCEEGKYYFAMRAVPTGSRDLSRSMIKNELPAIESEPDQELSDEFGGLLLIRRDSVLRQYLVFRRKIVSEILEKLSEEASKRNEKRQNEIRQELCLIDRGLQKYETS